MYKQVRLKEVKGKMWWTALHMHDDSGHSYNLRGVANDERVILGTEIVQQNRK